VRNRWKVVALVAVVAVVVAGCSKTEDDAGGSSSGGTVDTVAAADLEAIGLWDDPPCDGSLEPLEVGQQLTFASAVLTAEDQALALEASAEAFNARGGANGHCVEITTCDERADANAALACARTLDDAGVAVNVNDSSADPSSGTGDALESAGIARFAINSGTPDLSDPNSYPFDAGGIGTAMVMPQALVDAGITKIATIRVDLPAASALIGIFEEIYEADGAEFVADIPVAAGTTDYSQFILAAEDASAEGVIVPLGGQEAIQVLRAAQQLGSDLVFSTSLGTLPYRDLADLGDFADQVLLNGSTPPATADVPALDVLRSDLAASGEEALQPENLKTTPMHSWIGLYALLTILRDSGTEDFTRENITDLIQASGPIDMLGLTADWTPDTDNPGTFPRTGNGYYSFWKWDPDAEFDGDAGNLVQTSEIDFNDLLCGSSLGAPENTCG
jgi:ABC-type branched-subunit amino acid transport system substrate-binding protein